MKNLIFEVHSFAPEMNKVFLNGVKQKFKNYHRQLTKNYADNIRLLRSKNEPNKNRKGYILKKIYSNPDLKNYNKTISGLATPEKLLKMYRYLKDGTIQGEEMKISVTSYFI